MTQKQLAKPTDKTMMFKAFPALTDAGDGHQITIEEARSLISWAAKYDLDAWAGHVCYMYSKPYVTEKGALANAQKDKRYRGFVYPSINDADIKALGYPDPIAAWACEVYIDGFPNPITEYGVVTQSELDILKVRMWRNIAKQQHAEKYSDQDIESIVLDRLMYIPLWRQPSTMARARAIRRAHLLAFPLKGYVEPELQEARSAGELFPEDDEGLTPQEG